MKMKQTIKMPKDEFQNLIDISHGCKYSSANRKKNQATEKLGESRTKKNYSFIKNSSTQKIFDYNLFSDFSPLKFFGQLITKNRILKSQRVKCKIFQISTNYFIVN